MKKSGRNKKKGVEIYKQYGALLVFLVLLVVVWVIGKDRFLKKIDIQDTKSDLPIEKIKESVDNKREETKSIPVEDGKNGSVNILSQKSEDGSFSFEVNGNLAPLTKGNYVGWLFNSEKNHKVQLGNFVYEKSGFSLYFETKGDVSGYDRFLISTEIVADERIEKIILDYPFVGGR